MQKILALFPQHIFERLSMFIRINGHSRFDYVSPLIILVLMTTSVFFIYSAQSYSTGSQWKTQIVWIGLGLMTYMLISFIDYKAYLVTANIAYIGGILLLLLIWSPLGFKVYGAQRWVRVGSISFQPSDAAKLGTLLLGCSVLARSKITNFRDSLGVLFKVGCVFGIPCFLVFLQPDLGSCLIFPPLLFVLLFVAKLSYKFFVTTFTLFGVLMGVIAIDISGYKQYVQNPSEYKTSTYQEIAFLPLKDYQRNRILTFIAPEVVDPKGIGNNWNLRQSLIAIGSGGFWGKGHNNSTQAKLGYLPQSVAPNDFIFSVLAEESGFLGGSFVILLYMALILNGIRIGILAKDRFGMLLCVGSSLIFMIHIFVNIGMTIGLMPITGIPLPFLSYGGSFVLTCCALQGIIQSVYRFRRNI